MQHANKDVIYLPDPMRLQVERTWLNPAGTPCSPRESVFDAMFTKPVPPVFWNGHGKALAPRRYRDICLT